MFSVYQITNLINQKKYIGSSVRVKQRWREHINSSKNPNRISYNYPLQCAMRKYGIENFDFKILKDDFNSKEEMLKYEKEMILFHNTLNCGYNQILDTEAKYVAKTNLTNYIEKNKQKCAKIDKNNNILEIYESYHDAALKNNLDYNTASNIRNICKGKTSSIKDELIFRDLDENNQIIFQPFKPYKGKKAIIVINLNDLHEIYFDSISEAAELLNTDRWSITQCIQGKKRYSNVKGYIFRELDLNGNIIEVENTIENILENYNRTNPEINGERHNIKEWCEIYNISSTCYYHRIKKGMGVIEALTIPSKRR